MIAVWNFFKCELMINIRKGGFEPVSDVAACIQPEQAELVVMLHLVLYNHNQLCVDR